MGTHMQGTKDRSRPRKLISLSLALLLAVTGTAPAAYARETGEGTSSSGTGLAGLPLEGLRRAAAVPAEPPGTLAGKHLAYLAETIGTRPAGSEQEAQAAAYISGEFAKLGLAVEEQPFHYTVKQQGLEAELHNEGGEEAGVTLAVYGEDSAAVTVDVYSKNIIATKPGLSPKQIIVGAHYDSVTAGKGADDNASGVAVMLEAAETVAKLDSPYTIKFIAFGAEEEGLRGSKHYAAGMTEEEIRNTAVMINLDSLAAGDKMYIYGSAGSDGWVRTRGLALAEKLGLALETSPGLNPDYPKGTTGDWSDHAPFKAKGIPYAYLEGTNWALGDQDGYTQTVKDGEIWHTPKDTLAYLRENYPGRIEEHLKTFSQVLSGLLTEVGAAGELRLSSDKASMTEKREIEVGFDLPPGTELGELTWTYGGKPLEEWKQWSAKNKSYSGQPFISLAGEPVVEGGRVKAKIAFDLVYTLGNDVPTSNLQNRSIRVLYPELIGTYPLAVSGPQGLIGSSDIKLNVYDSYHTYDELKPAIGKLTSQAKNGRYIDTRVIGKSAEGRDILFTVVAKDQASVDTYLNETVPAMLEHPKEMQEKLASGQLSDVKVPVWINNIHPDEAPGVDVILDFLKTLAVEDQVTFKTKNGDDENAAETEVTLDVNKALDNVIFLLNYTQNPDGRVHNTRGNANGFDLNRDNSYQTQPETQAVTREIAKWSPLSFLDLHGFVGGFLIEPCTPPHDPNFEYDLLMDGMLEQARVMGRAGIANTSYDSYEIPLEDYENAWDDFTPAYTAMYAMEHGALGHTIEIPELNQESQKALYYAGLAAFQYVIDNKTKLFSNQLEYYKRGVEGEDNRAVDTWFVNAKGEVIGRPRQNPNESFFPDYYVLPVSGKLQDNPLEAHRMAEYLLHNGVKVERSTEAVKIEGTDYPAGSYVVDMRQAKRGYANVVLYDGSDVSDWEAMYAEIVQNFAELRGFDRYTVRKPGAFTGKTAAVTSVTIPASAQVGNHASYVVRNTNNAAIQAVNELLGQGKSVQLLVGGGEGYEMGDFLVAREDLAGVSGRYLLDFVPYDGAAAGKLLKSPKVAAVGSGETAFVLKGLGFSLSETEAGSDVIVDDAGAADKALIAAGKPYVGYGADALTLVKEEGLLPGFDFDMTDPYHEGLFRSKLVQTSLITAQYDREEYLYTAAGTWITSVPQGAQVLVKASSDANFFKAGWWPGHEEAKGQVIGLSSRENGRSITLFANTLTNKAHPQHQFRLLANAIYTAAIGLEPNRKADRYEVAYAEKPQSFKKNSEASVRIEVENKNGVDAQATLVVALYEKATNKMADYAYVTKSIEPGAKTVVSTGLHIPDSDRYEVRVFVWDNWNQARALAEPLKVQVLP
ncbi:M20/M25/M40 family metallo-hydrolase [Paenibacillus mucilaginosus]|uniref:M20/M25/M40 family metallo-hydrolase n=1 Tax=Paenibacillus mucilaginosus TaxID=61624 RepID=UPI00240D880B|nr:M20/M25/M40 family metallo-hydrolase [Paenibacillus mucilaginosus]WFA20163.1 M20/M25/M40 family metallo-hydrolase [Paenibacillus mucilaginosus]